MKGLHRFTVILICIFVLLTNTKVASAADSHPHTTTYVTNMYRGNLPVMLQVVLVDGDDKNIEACFKTLLYTMQNLMAEGDWSPDYFVNEDNQEVGIKIGKLDGQTIVPLEIRGAGDIIFDSRKPFRYVRQFMALFQRSLDERIKLGRFLVESQTDYKIAIWADPQQNTSSYFTIYFKDDFKGDILEGSREGRSIKRSTQKISCHPYRQPFQANYEPVKSLEKLIMFTLTP